MTPSFNNPSDCPPIAASHNPSCANVTADWPTIEGYDIVDEVGRGGMGVVYEAFQASTGRRVAIKVMAERLAMHDEGRRRFEREVALAARLQHPQIAAVIDSGVHQGRYFYVMEYVQGVPLDVMIRAFRDSNSFGTATHMVKVLRLLAASCDAIDYAHQRGVLHRDLKPQNIVVDAAGVPHILDFGLAKAIDPFSGAERDQTLAAPGQVLGTLGYMSPEQARGEHDAASVRGDVYSLGVIAYELLTGQLPLDTGGSLSDVLHRLNTVDPFAPSVALRRSAFAVVRRPPRGVSIRDSDAVVLRALHKSPAHRYATAALFAADIRRLVSGDSVTARHVGPATRATRWVGRHRAISGVIGASLLVLTLGGAWSVKKIINERDRTRQAADEAQTVSQFLSSLLASANLYGEHGPQTTIGQLLDEAAEKLKSNQHLSPRSRLLLSTTIANSYGSLGLNEKCETLMQEALSIARALGGEDRVALQLLADLVTLACLRGDPDSAEGLAKEAAGIRARIPDAGAFERARSAMDIGRIAQARGDYNAAAASYETALAESREGRLPDAITADVLDLLQGVLFEAGRYEECVRLSREGLALRERVSGKDHVVRISSLHTLGMSLQAQGKLTEAILPLGEALRLARLHMRRDGDDLPSVINAHGMLLLEAGRFDEAESLLVESLEMCRSNHPGDHPLTASMMNNLGSLYAQQDRLELAIKWAGDAVKAHRRAYGPKHHSTHVALYNLADVQCRLRLWEAARKSCKSALAGFQSGHGDFQPDVAGCLGMLARIESSLGNAAAAEPLCIEALAILAEHRDATGPDECEVLTQLIRAQVVLGRHDDALLTSARHLDATHAHWGDDQSRLATALGWRFHVLSDAERWLEAVIIGERLLDIDFQTHGPIHRQTLQHQRMLGRAYAKAGQEHAARQCLQPLVGDAAVVHAQTQVERAESMVALSEALGAAGCDAVADDLSLRALVADGSLSMPPVQLAIVWRRLADAAGIERSAAHGLIVESTIMHLRAVSPFHCAVRPRLCEWAWAEYDVGRLAEFESIMETAINAYGSP